MSASFPSRLLPLFRFHLLSCLFFFPAYCVCIPWAFHLYAVLRAWGLCSMSTTTEEGFMGRSIFQNSWIYSKQLSRIWRLQRGVDNADPVVFFYGFIPLSLFPDIYPGVVPSSPLSLPAYLPSFPLLISTFYSLPCF